MSGFRILGIVVALLGIAASVFPTWFEPLTGGPEPPADVYEAIERRVRGGMVLLGLADDGITECWRPRENVGSVTIRRGAA